MFKKLLLGTAMPFCMEGTGDDGSGSSGGGSGNGGNIQSDNEGSSGDSNQSSNAGNNGNSTGSNASEELEAKKSDYELPEEYRGKSWADKIKTQDDLYKQIDNLTELVGKKTIKPIDYDTATPEQIATHHKSLVPEDAGAYKFSESTDPEFSKALVPALQEAGIHPAQLKTLEPAINKIASELVGKQYETDRSEDGYLELTKEAFGENHEKVIVQLENFYKDHTPENVKAFLDDASNKERAIFDQMSKAIIDAKDAEIAKLKKEYGIEETGAQGDGERATQKVSIDDEINVKRKEIDDLNNKIGQKDWTAINKAKEDLRMLYDKKAKMQR